MDELRGKIQASDWRVIGVVAALLLASTIYVWSNYEAAFPQASLDLPIRQDEITAAAEAFLVQRVLKPDGFRNLTTFEPDDQARLYLERELGLDQANRLMRSEVPVWRWRARWFRPPDKEERIVYMRTNGRLLAFEHRVPETDAGARLDMVSARLIAESFLQGQTRLPHRLISEQTEKRPNRDDHVFTWEQENFKAKEATLRRSVVVYGDRVGRYREFLHIPEQWERDFSRLRSSNELYEGIAQGFYLILTVAALVVLVLHMRRQSIRWKPLLMISAVVAVFHLLNELNTLRFTIDGMPTSSPYSEMVALALLQAVGASTGIFLYVMGPAAAGAPLYARSSQHVPLADAFSIRGMATRSYFRAVVAGFGMAAGHMAFLTAFYLIGAKVGVWSPQEVDYSNVLATPMPWLYPISIALMASTAEEFWFRLLAIPLLGRFLRQKWLVIAIPAFVWGFLHANYPQQPGYIRGLEVGIIGVAAGYLMLRFGIVATLVWHYVIDAFLIGMLLFRAGSWTYQLHGCVVGLAILTPLLVPLIFYRRNQGFLPEMKTEPAPVDSQPPQTVPAQLPAAPPKAAPGPLLPDTVLWIAAGLFALTALAGRPVEFGDFIQLKTPRRQAEDAAKQQMRSRGLDPSQWRMGSDFSVNLRRAEAEYLRQRLGARQANQALEKHLEAAVWRVRFFRPLEREEWNFYINQNGRAYRFDHELDENAPGAKLPPEEARRKAEQYLSSEHGIPIQSYRLVDSQEEKRKQRTDHSFVWEHADFSAGDARLRLSLSVIGDETCEFRRFFKLPEQWLREYQKPRLQSYLMPAYIGALAMSLLVILVRRLGAPDQRFHWRTYGWIATAGLIGVLAARVNEWPAYLLSYDTSATLENFYGQLLASRLSVTLLAAGGFLLCSLAVDAFQQRVFGNWWLPPPSLARAAAVAALVITSSKTVEWIRQMVPGMLMDPSLFYLGGLDTAFPAIAVLEGALLVSFYGIALTAMFLAGLVTRMTKRGLIATALVILGLLAVSGTIELRQLPGETLAALAILTVLALIAGNVLSDLVSAWIGLFWALAAGQCWLMISQPDPFLKGNGVAAAAMAVFIGVAVAAKVRTRVKGPS
jgi:hypothetical protein